MIDLESVQKAISLTQKGLLKEAEGIYSELINKHPDEAVLLSAAGLFYASIQNYEKAVELLEKAYNKQKTFGVVSALATALYEKGEYKKAGEIFKEALEYGENPDIYNKLISCMFEIKNYNEAIQYSDKMYELYPNEVHAAVNKVKSLTQSGRLAEAERMCVEYLKKNMQEPLMWFQLGYLKELLYCDDKQARECYKAAEQLDCPQANYNIAVSCYKLGEKTEAEKYYKKMLEYFPDDIETQTSLGMCYLSQKKFNQGYKLFYNRAKGKVQNLTNNLYKIGDKLQDDLVIICEQGYGDHIQFIRYLPFIPAKNVKIALPETLRKLFQINYTDYEYIDYSEINPEVQALRVTDLAYILGMDFNHIPFSEGYLKAEPKNIKSEKLKVGLCWEAGAAGIRNMINRTIHVKLFEPLINTNNIQVYSFQYNDTFKGNEKYPQMINLAKDFTNFADTASALLGMDVVVTVDTSVAHLAGALGVKTWLMLPYAADWRWFDDNKTTPWYKSIEIFKQDDPISWQKPLADIIEKLGNV